MREKKRLPPIIHPFLIGVINILIFTISDEAMKRFEEKVVLWYTLLIVSDYLNNSSKLIAFLNRSSLTYHKGAECPHVWRMAMTHVNTLDLHRDMTFHCNPFCEQMGCSQTCVDHLHANTGRRQMRFQLLILPIVTNLLPVSQLAQVRHSRCLKLFLFVRIKLELS